MKGLDELLQRFYALEARERQFLIGGAIALVIIIFFLAVVQPLVQYRESVAEDVTRQRALVSWMQGAVDVLRKRGPAEAAVDTSGSLLALADTSARAAGLANAMRRIQQEGDDAVRMRLESASFDALILWLDTLQNRYGVIASEMTVDRADAAGRVNASITLTRSAS
ncbi:MAG TPA: type II secretion system protein M [Gammaproteobacteria bacterium]